MEKHTISSQKKSYWQQLLNSWSKSGMTIANFCKEKKIAHSGFYSWKKRLSFDAQRLPTSRKTRQTAQNFIPIEITPNKPPVQGDRKPIQIDFQDGTQLHLDNHCELSIVQSIFKLIRG